MDAGLRGRVGVVEALAPAIILERRDVAFAGLFSNHEAYVLRALRRLGVAEADVEDLGIEVFLAVHRKMGELDAERPVKPWLFAFCFRVAANHRRGMLRRRTSAEMADVEDGKPRADQLLEREDDKRLVIEALRALDLDRRAVFVMHFLDETPIPEVARALEIPLGTAYTRLRTGKKTFVDEVRRLQKAGLP